LAEKVLEIESKRAESDEHAMALASARDEHAMALASARDEHAMALASTRDEHAMALAAARDEIAQLAREVNTLNVNSILESVVTGAERTSWKRSEKILNERVCVLFFLFRTLHFTFLHSF
jgi:hypothetical protein